MGFEGGLYPKTGQYRENKSLVEEHSEEAASGIVAYLEGKEARSAWSPLEHMFGISGENESLVTAEERNDVKNFINYATKRLSNSTLASRVNHARLEAIGARRLLNREMPRDTGDLLLMHDLLHAAVAYIRTDGKSLTPRFLQVEGKGEQFTDTEAHQEELMVHMWDQQTLRLTDFENVRDAIERSLARQDLTPEKRRKVDQHLKSLGWSLFSGVNYALGAYELLYFVRRGLTIDVRHEESLRTIRENRDPDYVRIFTKIYNNSRSANPNPKILLDEFREALSPLLSRLRTKESSLSSIETVIED